MSVGEQVLPGTERAVAESLADADPADPASGVGTADAAPAGRLPPAGEVPPPDGPLGADTAPDAAPYAAAGNVSLVPPTRIGFTGPANTDRTHVIPPTSTSPPTRMKNRRRQ
jgi:hypothetical protein